MNPESNEALSRRVAEAAGWTVERSHKEIPVYATSLDAIAALEHEAGLQVDVYAMANPDDGYHVEADGVWASADTEPRARCLAYLAWASEEGRG